VLIIDWQGRGLCLCLWYARSLCLCPCVITPRRFTSLPTQEVEYSFPSFIPTNKQINKQTSARGLIIASPFPPPFSPFFEIGRLLFARSDFNWTSIEGDVRKGDVLLSQKGDVRSQNVDWSLISQKGDVRSQKEREGGGKRAVYDPWELWSDPCGTRLAPGLKPLRMPRAQIFAPLAEVNH